MIDGYKMNCNILEDVVPECDSNSIAQYGIQATLPKPQGENGSKVEDVVIRLERTNKRYAQMLKEVEFINQSQQKLGHVDFCFLEHLFHYFVYIFTLLCFHMHLCHFHFQTNQPVWV